MLKYFDTTSMVGFNRVNESKYCIEKGFWIFILAGFICWTGYDVYRVTRIYLSDGTWTKMEIKHNESIGRWPLTICALFEPEDIFYSFKEGLLKKDVFQNSPDPFEEPFYDYEVQDYEVDYENITKEILAGFKTKDQFLNSNWLIQFKLKEYYEDQSFIQQERFYYKYFVNILFLLTSQFLTTAINYEANRWEPISIYTSQRRSIDLLLKKTKELNITHQRLFMKFGEELLKFFKIVIIKNYDLRGSHDRNMNNRDLRNFVKPVFFDRMEPGFYCFREYIDYKTAKHNVRITSNFEHLPEYKVDKIHVNKDSMKPLVVELAGNSDFESSSSTSILPSLGERESFYSAGLTTLYVTEDDDSCRNDFHPEEEECQRICGQKVVREKCGCESPLEGGFYSDPKKFYGNNITVGRQCTIRDYIDCNITKDARGTGVLFNYQCENAPCPPPCNVPFFTMKRSKATFSQDETIDFIYQMDSHVFTKFRLKQRTMAHYFAELGGVLSLWVGATLVEGIFLITYIPAARVAEGVEEAIELMLMLRE